MNAHIHTERTLADEALLARVKTLADRERGATVELIAHLMEVERRKLYLASGYSAMFTYCRGALGLSEGETVNRIRAARAARRFPVILDWLAEGAVNLTTVKLLAPLLTEDNHLALLRSARGLSRREVEKIVARVAPVPDAPTSVRRLPAPTSAPTPAPGSTRTPTSGPAVVPGPLALDAATDLFAAAASTDGPVSAPSTPLSTRPPAAPTTARVEAPATLNVLSPDRYKLQVTISGETLEKLELVKDMIRHAVPSGDVAQILDRALTLLASNLAKSKFAVTDRPRPSPGVAPDSREIPAEVKRIVFVRDLGRCAFVAKDGHRCDERSRLEFHHVQPFAEGGLPTVENIQLRCRLHNLYEWHLRSTDVRAREDEWLYRQVAAGIVPWTADSATDPGTSGRRRSSRGTGAPQVVPSSP